MLRRHFNFVKYFLAKRNIKFRHLIYGVIILLVLLISTIKLLDISPYNASGSVQYYRAKVLSVNETQNFSGNEQTISSRLLDGPDKGQVTTVSRDNDFGDSSYKRLPVGSDILLTKQGGSGNQYAYADRWHIPGIASLFLLLLVLVIVIGWWRGITSVFGLVISIGVLSVYVIPEILDGRSPLEVCIIGAFIITLISVFVAHGFSKRTSIAFASSIITLVAVIGLVGLGTYLTGTSEVINEENAGVLYSGSHSISLSGLLTGGIIIASLGVLFDITTGQSAAVDEVYKANKRLGTRELYRRGLSVGREHIAALVNTLALVYVGIALPLIITTALYNNHAPLIVSINNEAVVEEIVRSFVAAIGMLIAVPITTYLAAYLLPKWYAKSK